MIILRIVIYIIIICMVQFRQKIIDYTNDFKQDNNYFKISNEIDFTYNDSSSKELSL